jgi:aryl-alcohol dehydrogenase-like predicted oxidoreductase
MTFGEDNGWGTSPEASEVILAEYLERGGNVVDTANIYTNGHSEKIIGDFFAARSGLRDRVVLSTTFFANLYPGDPNGGGGGRKALIAQLHKSLRRLQTADYVDLYWLHGWDRRAPIEETLRALDDLVAAGKVRYVGLSDVPAWVAAQGQAVAHFRGWAPVTALQLEYSLLERAPEGELLPMAEELGVGVLSGARCAAASCRAITSVTAARRPTAREPAAGARQPNGTGWSSTRSRGLLLN